MRTRLRKIPIFSKEWFDIWQPLLLLAVNFPVKSIREEIRWKLGIQLDRNILINWLFPHSFRVKIGDREYQQCFYTRYIFARALAKEWRFIWDLVHKWDTSFANKFIPVLNLGFDTLTVYSDNSSGATTCDGTLVKSGANGDSPETAISNVRSGNADSVSSLSDELLSVRWNCVTYTEEPFLGKVNAKRFFMTFDTSSLTSDAVISESMFTIDYSLMFITAILMSHTSANANTFATSDWSTIGTESLGGLVFGENGYWNCDLEKTCISKTGITKLAAIGMCDRDLAFTDQGEGRFTSTDTAGSYPPKITITYTLPITFIPKIMVI